MALFAACSDEERRQGTVAGGLDASLSDAGLEDSGFDFGDGDAHSFDASATLLRLRNINPAVCTELGIFAQPDEIGHWGAARLTPPEYPFVVEEVGHRLIAGTPACGVPTSHRVMVFRSENLVPPSEPTIEAELFVEAPPSADRLQEIRRSLNPTLRLETGQHLYVAVQYPSAPPGGLCLSTCVDPTDANLNFWSNRSTPPFSWTTLASFGLPNSFTIFASGQRPD